MNKFAFMILPLLLLGCKAEDISPPPLAGARLGGSFSLINQDGQKATEQDFAGRYRIVYTGYTNCPDICPTDALVIGQALQRFEAIDKARAARVIPIFMSADPERDTPARLKAFLANFHPRYVGLTGPVKDVDQVLGKYGSYGLRDKKTGIVDHGRTVVLYAPDGKPITPLPVTETLTKFVEQLDYWVR